MSCGALITLLNLSAKYITASKGFHTQTHLEDKAYNLPDGFCIMLKIEQFTAMLRAKTLANYKILIL